MVKTTLCVLISLLPLLAAVSSGALVHFDFEQPYFIEPGVLIKDHSLIHVGNVYHLFYLRGTSVDIGHATSTDLIHWKIEPPVLGVEPGAWDGKALWAPQVLEFPFGGYLMYYTGANQQWSQQTGLALSSDLYWWDKLPEPIYHPDPAWAEWTDSTWSHGRDPFVFEYKRTLYMLVTTKNKWNKGAIASAVSHDYVNWQDNGPLYVHDSWHVLESVQLIHRNSKFHLFFTEEGVYGTSHMMSDSLYSGWDSSTRMKIDPGQAPEIDLFDGAYIFSGHDGYYDEHGITRYLLRFDTLRWEDDTPEVYRPWPLSKNWNLVDGTAFDCQPTFGNNPFIRGDSVDVGYEGHCWIGTYERYQGPLMNGSRGDVQGDSAWGMMRSSPFVITGDSMNLLVGGGNYPAACYVALVDSATGGQLFKETGGNTEVMTRRYWNVAPYKGKKVYVEIADFSQQPFGHINVDDITETMTATATPESVVVAKKGKNRPSQAEPSGYDAGHEGDAPAQYVLFENAPNPFNPTTSISYYLPRESHVLVEIFGVNGALVRRLVNAVEAKGRHSVLWNGRGGGGGAVSTGIYFCRLTADGKIVDTKKMMLVK
jgi:hypothetical protein